MQEERRRRLTVAKIAAIVTIGMAVLAVVFKLHERLVTLETTQDILLYHPPGGL